MGNGKWSIGRCQFSVNMDMYLSFTILVIFKNNLLCRNHHKLKMYFTYHVSKTPNPITIIYAESRLFTFWMHNWQGTVAWVRFASWWKIMSTRKKNSNLSQVSSKWILNSQHFNFNFQRVKDNHTRLSEVGCFALKAPCVCYRKVKVFFI